MFFHFFLGEVNMADAGLELENAIPEMPDMSMEGPRAEKKHGWIHGDFTNYGNIFLDIS
jgi:hypothetical protein